MQTGLVKRWNVDKLEVSLFEDQPTLARAVTAEVENYLASLESFRAILATGNSQIEFLKHLSKSDRVQWSQATLFHMDEYLGLSGDHTASFRRYMRERVEELVRPKEFHYIEGDADEPIDECDRYESLLRESPIDLCCMGVGENGHIAFNDPHVANAADTRWAKIVSLDVACRMQQVNEGHFPDLESAPPYAITLTIPALLSAKKIMCVAPETRKADAVTAALEGPISPDCPASFLRTIENAKLFIDRDSAARLKGV